ncbi:MAG: aldolase/citrate lyase family protein [Salinivirgaceae bacterium]|jgi:citrate lyase subunit beta/citryl-CoA lyase|nr:aldolase/citrate lyase family protein [Salinivirgaceae bacterium]
MLKTYFFVPSNNTKFLKNVPLIGADYFIYDLEDSVSKNEMSAAIGNLRSITITENSYVRPKLYNEDDTINSDLFSQLIKIGFKNYLIPKVSNLSQIEALKGIFKITSDNFKNFKFILLVEHPAGLINLTDIIRSNLLNITSVGLGNYDYCSVMGMRHTLENLTYARNVILNIAKAHELEAIDIVSLNLASNKEFQEESLNGFSLGFDGKFVIHPLQIALLKEIQFYSDEEIKEAKLVYSQILDIDNELIPLIKVNGKVYEKPHIKRIINIINWNSRFNNKHN